MNTPHTHKHLAEFLMQSGMCQIPNNESSDGFSGSLTWVISKTVREILQHDLKIVQEPDYLKLENVRVRDNGNILYSSSPSAAIKFSVMALTRTLPQEIYVLSDRIGTKLESRVGSRPSYKIEDGDIFTLKKNYSNYLKTQ